MFAGMLERIGEMPAPISNSEYISRQSKLFDTLAESDILILCAAGETIHSNDVHHPYRTQSNLLYLTGWTEPEAVFCACHNGKEWETHLFVQPKDLSLIHI